MLYLRRVMRALKGNTIRQVRILSGIKPRPKAPVLSQDIGDIVERHSRLCRQLQELFPADLPIQGAMACEAGPGDCLATAALVIGMGAKHVDLVEIQPPVANKKQMEVLRRLREQGLPVDLDILRSNPSIELNPDKVTYHTRFMDDFVADRKYSLIYSFCVLEHVEDLLNFFTACFRATMPGGYNLHMIDLGGHGEYEDPIPPLDFQTLPDWLYDLMYPPFYRATRRFMGDYLRALEGCGFSISRLHHLRTAEPAYVKSIQPRLRPAAKTVPLEELGVIEFAVEARRPA